VKFTDNKYVAVEGLGKVLIKGKNGKPIVINGVLYVPSMTSNLLSIG
jgi:hypothetical protein